MSVYKMSNSQLMKFVRLYREAKCLWDVNSPEYKQREARDQALTEISEVMSIEGFGPREVAQKIKNVRSAYIQEVKKISSSLNSSDGEVYRPKVPWFDIVHAVLKNVSKIPLNETGSDESPEPKHVQEVSVSEDKKSADQQQLVETVSKRQQQLLETRSKQQLVESTSKQQQSVEPLSERQQQLMEARSKQQLVEARSKQQLVEPTSKQQQLVEPTSKQQQSVEPVSKQQSVEPVSRQQSVESTPRQQQYIESPSKSTAVSEQPSVAKKRYLRKRKATSECVVDSKSNQSPGEETEFDLWCKSLAKQLNSMDTARALKIQIHIQVLVSNERIAYEKRKGSCGCKKSRETEKENCGSIQARECFSDDSMDSLLSSMINSPSPEF